MNEQEISEYLDKIPFLQNRLQSVIQQMKKPIGYILSSSLQQKLVQCQEPFKLDTEWAEQYKQVIAYLIEGNKNTSLMGLYLKMKQFVQADGLIFWLDLICSFATNQKYSQKLSIWHVNNQYRMLLPVSREDDARNRKFQRTAKLDLNATKLFLTSIKDLKQKLKNPQSSKKSIQALVNSVRSYEKKHQQADKKLSQVLKIQFKECKKQITLGQFSIFNKNKNNLRNQSNSMSKIGSKNRKKPNQGGGIKQKTITEFADIKSIHHPLHKKLNTEKQEKQEKKVKALQLERQKFLEDCFLNAEKPRQTIESLKSMLRQQRPRKQITDQTERQFTFINIYDPVYFFQYVNFPIKNKRCQQFNMAKPQQKKKFVKYQIWSQDEYQDIADQGTSLDSDIDDIQISEDSDPLDSDEIQSIFDREYDQNLGVNQRHFQGRPWHFSTTNQTLTVFQSLQKLEQYEQSPLRLFPELYSAINLNVVKQSSMNRAVQIQPREESRSRDVSHTMTLRQRKKPTTKNQKIRGRRTTKKQNIVKQLII